MRPSYRKINYVGKTVTVKQCPGGYRLPDGLPDCARAKIVAQDIGYFEVEFDGKRYCIAVACVQDIEKLKV